MESVFLKIFKVVGLVSILILFLGHNKLISQEGKRIPRHIQERHDSIIAYKGSDSLKAFSFTDELLKAAQSSGSDQDLAYFYFEKANILIDWSEYERSKFNFEKSLKLALALEYVDHKLLALIYNNYAYLLSNTSDSNLSKKYTWLAYQHNLELDDQGSMADNSFAVASKLMEEGKYIESSKFIEQALEIDLKLGDSMRIFHDVSFMALLNYKMQNYNQAISKYFEGLSYIVIENDISNYINIYGTIGEVYIAHEQYEKALEHLQKYNIDSISNVSLTDRLRYKTHLAHALHFNGFNELATIELENIKEKAQDYNLGRECIRSNFVLGKISSNYSRAITYLTESLRWAELLNVKEYFSLIYPIVIKRAKEFGDQNTENKYSRLYIEYLKNIQDQNLQATSESMIAGIELFTIEERNNKLELANAKAALNLTQQQNRTFLFMGLLALALTFSWGVYMYFRQQRLSVEIQHSKQLSDLKDKLADLISKNNSEIELPSFLKLNSLINEKLTNKEYEILSEVLRRKTNVQIAKDHFISINTVKYHLKNIYTKLDVPNKKRVLERIQSL